MQFSNGIIAPLILQPLRYHFSTATLPFNLRWDEDEKLRTIDIGETFDFNAVPLQLKPRVVVSRGGYSITKTGLSDNLAEAPAMKDTFGNQNRTNMVFYQGNASVIIQARNKGTCEIVADMVSHFLIWTRPTLCDVLGFKEFGLPSGVSDCELVQDEDPNVPKFQIQLSVPWIKEEHWQLKTDGGRLKSMLLSIKPV